MTGCTGRNLIFPLAWQAQQVVRGNLLKVFKTFNKNSDELGDS